jgi:hypothetical protein
MHTPLRYDELLLRILTHDLLAPLTAIKWQVEILEKKGNREEPHNVILQDSVAIGIALVKRAQVASVLMGGKYAIHPLPHMVASVLETVCVEIKTQCERHGVGLEWTCDPEKEPRIIDIDIVSLFVWSVVRFFLTFSEEKKVLSVRGVAPPQGESGAYTFIVSGEESEEAKKAVAFFQGNDEVSATEERVLFSSLIHEIAQALAITVSMEVRDGVVIFDSAFLVKN